MQTSWSAFQRLWEELALTGAANAWYERLRKAYAEPGRAYHNLWHLEECLVEFKACRRLAREPALVELALWFHDAVYDPQAAGNEEKSAALVEEFLVDSGMGNRTMVERVKSLVLLTKTHEVAADSDGALLVDADLSILGRPWARFEEYDRAIRQEYAWVPPEVYAAKRGEVLRRFLQRDFIYRTRHFREKYEWQARENLGKRLGLRAAV